MAAVMRLGVDEAGATELMGVTEHARALAHYGPAARLARGRDRPDRLLEILGVVDHYTALNTLSEAMQIESDIRPPA